MAARSRLVASLSLTKNQTSARDTRPTGTLIRNTQCQEKESVSQPPRIGPMAGAMTMVSPYSAKACGRMRNGNVSAKIDCSTGARPPPPTPCMTRQKIICCSVPAVAHIAELIVKMATHSM
jgi:hypothetical protein